MVSISEFAEGCIEVPKARGREQQVEEAPHGPPTPAPAPKRKRLTTEQQVGLALAGVVAGVGSRTCTAPLERLKTMAQTGQVRGSITSSFQHIVHTEGALALFRGNLMNCLKVAPQKALKFLGYENLKYAICKNPYRPTMAEDFGCSVTMSCIALAVTFPLDTLKTRLSVSTEKETVATAIRQLRDNGGLWRFYKGMTPALLSAAPFSGISLTVFMQGKLAYKEYSGIGGLEAAPVSVMLGLSAVANISAQLVSYPLYCIKTNMQNASSSDPAEGMWACGNRLVRTRGVANGLFSGFGMSVLKAMPAMASSFIIYEEAKSFLGIRS
jgi:solute carrier family 25 phosphate transporter 23/24/25/41